MNQENFPTEHIAEEILRRMDEGESYASILALHPEWEKEIRDVTDAIKSLSAFESIEPSQELLRETLSRMETPLPTPVSTFRFSFWQVGVSVLALVVVIVTGTAFLGHGITPASSDQGTVALSNTAADTSDDALAAEAAGIDSQLGALDSDTSEADQALSHGTSAK